MNSLATSYGERRKRNLQLLLAAIIKSVLLRFTKNSFQELVAKIFSAFTISREKLKKAECFFIITFY